MALRDRLRLRRRARRAREELPALSEEEVRRLQQVQRATQTSVRVVRRDD